MNPGRRCRIMATGWELLLYGLVILWVSLSSGSALENCDLDITNQTTGTIQSPNYGVTYSFFRPFECFWRITVRAGHRIKVVYNSPFDIDRLGYDKLYVYDGPEPRKDKELYKYGLNGNRRPSSFTTTGNSLYVVFRVKQTPGFTIGGKGFSITFTEYSSKVEILPEVTEGVIANEGYPFNYLANEEFAWQISVPIGLHIHLAFTDWGLINRDILTIYKGTSANESNIVWGLTRIYVDKRYSAPPESSMPNVFVPGNSAYLTLETKHEGRLAINYRGLDLSLCPSVRPPDNGFIQAPEVQTVNSQVTFSCNAGYKLLGRSTLTCVPDTVSKTTPNWDGNPPVCKASTACAYNIDFQSGSGVLTSPGYPNSYSASVDCSWHISSNPKYQIELIFSGPFGMTYGESFLDIHDGGTQSNIRLARLTGELKPTVPLSSSNEVFVNFRGNGSSSGPGFSLTYRVPGQDVDRCGQSLPEALRGNLTSPDYPAPLKRGIRCEWTLRVPEGHVIQLLPTRLTLTEVDPPIKVIYRRHPTVFYTVFRKQFVSNTNEMHVQVDTTDFTSDQPPFLLTYIAIPTEVVLAGVTEGILTSPNYPEPSVRGVELWWNLTAPAGHRFTFQIFDIYLIYSSTLSFFEYIQGNWTEFASVTRKFQQKKIINIDSSSGSVFIRLSKGEPKVKFRYQAFPSTQCPTLFAPGVTFAASGYNLGDVANVSCEPGHNLTGPRQLTCVQTTNLYNETLADWDSREVSCAEDYCSQMLHSENSTHGYVQSVGFPAMARFRLDCQVPITVPENHVIGLRFTASRLPYRSPVKIIEDGRFVYTLDYREVPTTFLSTGNAIKVYLKSESYVGVGFRLVYEAIPRFTPQHPLMNESLCPHPGNFENVQSDSNGSSFQIGATVTYTCPVGTLAVGSLTLTCVNSSTGVSIWDYPPPFCSAAMLKTCNRTVRSGSGTISPMMSLDYEPCAGYKKNYYSYCSSSGNKYIDSQDCRVYFDLPEGFIVRLEKTYFNLVRDDSLMIYDGLSTQDALIFNLTYTFIQAQPPSEFPHHAFHSRSNQLLVRFVSNADSGGRRYAMKYKVIREDGCPAPPSFPQYGWVQAARYSGPYEDGDRLRYGCRETFNRTGEFRVCNGTSHEWSGSASVCQASHFYERTISPLSHLYTPDYPDPYFRISQGSWNFTAPTGMGIEMFIMKSCRVGAWNDRFRFYDASGTQVAQRFFQNTYYITSVLNTRLPEVHRIPSDRLLVNFAASDWRANGEKCEIQLKPYELPASCDRPLPGRHRRLLGLDHRLGQTVDIICDHGFYLPDGWSDTTSATCETDRKWTPAIPDCEAPCGGNLTAPDGVIYSPRYPDLYPTNVTCVWRIEGPIGTIVSLNFSQFDLRIGSYSYHDTFSAQEGSGRWLFKEFRGNHKGLFHLTESNTVLLTLKTNPDIYPRNQNIDGLKTMYTVYRPYKCSPLQEVRFIDHRKITEHPENGTVTVEYICQYPYSVIGPSTITCLPDGQWDNPEPICAGSCGVQTNRKSGVILSPGYPDVVTANDVCTWNLTGNGTKGTGIRLELLNVSLAEDDILAIYDGRISEKPTYYTWKTLPQSLCGTALEMNVRLIPKGNNSGMLGAGTMASCTENPECECRRADSGCLRCQLFSDISGLRRCLKASGVVDPAESEREVNCTILAIARAFADLFGGTISGLNISTNCSDSPNMTELSPAVLQCLEQSSGEPCTPCRTSHQPRASKFWIPFSGDVHLQPCQKPDLLIPKARDAYILNARMSAEVGEPGFIYCSEGLTLGGAEGDKVMCRHSGRWDLRGVECSCNRRYTYSYAVITTLAYPRNNVYFNDLHCTYDISVPQGNGYNVRMRFKYLSIAPNDFLVIYNGNTTASPVLAEYENTGQVPADVYSSTSDVLMTFTSDSSGVSAGFKVEYTTVPVACNPSSWQGVQLTGTERNTAVDMDMTYTRGYVCTWKISAPPQYVIKMSVDQQKSQIGGTWEKSIYEGDRMDTNSLRVRRNTTELLREPYLSRKSTVWLRLVLLRSYSEIRATLNITAVVGCARPPDPANGAITDTQITFSRGDVLSVRCNPGFELRDQQNRVCVEVGRDSLQWSGPIPICDKTDLPDVPPTTKPPPVSTGGTSVLPTSHRVTDAATDKTTPSRRTTVPPPTSPPPTPPGQDQTTTTVFPSFAVTDKSKQNDPATIHSGGHKLTSLWILIVVCLLLY